MKQGGTAFRRHRRLFILTLLVVLGGLGPGLASRLGSWLQVPGLIFAGGAIELDLVDVNRAPAMTLQDLPRIGPVLAQRMVRERNLNGPFTGPADLRRVKGIGRATVDRIGPYIEFGGGETAEPGG